MADTEYREPPLPPRSSLNTQDANPRTHENPQDANPRTHEMAVEASTNEGSSGGDLSRHHTISTRYHLRGGRGVDAETLLEREEKRRMRLERIKNKRLRVEQEMREAKESMDRALKNKEILDAKSKAWKEEKRKKKLSQQGPDIDDCKTIYTWEVINHPPKDSGEWLPYESDDEFGTEFDLKHTSWGVEKFALDLARCMVGLESSTGDKKPFSCSGTIVEYVEGTAYVVTSASLVRCPDKDEQVDNPKINVCLASGQILEGFVSNVDLYYNICLIKVPCSFELPRQNLCADTELFNFYENWTRDVVALGRSSEPWSLKVALGKLIPRRGRFDCEELHVSSCKISKIGVGGPLMDFKGNIIGMNFYDKKGTPFLPSFILLKCLQHFKNFGKVIRPLHGLRLRSLYEAELSVLEGKMQHELPEMSGVIVEKVEDSSAEHSDIKVGDIITHVNGVPFSSSAELGGMLLDLCSDLMLDRENLNLSDNQSAPVMSLKFHVRMYRGCQSEITTQAIDVDKFTPGGLNRWPLPRPIIVRQYAHGRVVDVRRYVLASDV